MGLLGYWTMAWRSIRAARLRSLLAVIGIVIGVAATVLVLALGAAARREVQRSIDALGANMVMVFPIADASQSRAAGAQRRRRLTEQDARAIRMISPEVRAVAAQVRLQVRMLAAGRASNATLTGVDDAYFDISRVTVMQGRRLEAHDARSRRLMLNMVGAQRLFPDGDAVGRSVRIDTVEFIVVGVYETAADGAIGTHEVFALAPIDSVRRRFARTGASEPDAVDAILAQYDRAETLAQARDDVVSLLRKRYRVRDGEIDPFTVYTTEEFARGTAQIVDVVRLTLVAIASISLLVGGIGIMNVMLVAVAERTREIGVRLAVGASPREIRRQFLVESALICLLGGVIGTGVAISACWAIAALTGWAVGVSAPTWAFALAFSSAIGLLAGHVPAARASRLEPIRALRDE
ncbi:MAG: ABC transporter permease [Pelomonas sp.]|nr:ABC transporter permease [Roseateles sp.]MBV8604390.1 ABC transporter permease [Roseateles sp.]